MTARSVRGARGAYPVTMTTIAMAEDHVWLLKD